MMDVATMPKIVRVDGVSYEQVAPNSIYEDEVERYIQRHATVLYPDHHILQFKLLVEAEKYPGGAKPDLVFIGKDYSEWWLVEVEMTYHPLYTHVLPQIRTLFNAQYGEREAVYVHKKNRALDVEKLTQLFKTTPPRLLVIANGLPDPSWFTDLKLFTEISIFEIYRSMSNDEIFALNGWYVPKFVREILSDCSFVTSFGLLQVDKPESLNLVHRGIITLHLKDCICEWRRVEFQNKVWLEPVSRLPIAFHERSRYQLVKHTDDSIGLVIIENKEEMA